MAAPKKIPIWSYCACISVTDLRFTETWIIGEPIEISTRCLNRCIREMHTYPKIYDVMVKPWLRQQKSAYSFRVKSLICSV